MSYLQRYNGDVNFLRQQPYSFGFFAERDQNFRDYDFFNRVKVDDTLYGGRAGFAGGPVPFRVRVSHLDEDVTQTLLPSQRKETSLSLNASNIRDRGDTTLTYSLTDYDRRYSTGSDLAPWMIDHFNHPGPVGGQGVMDGLAFEGGVKVVVSGLGFGGGHAVGGVKARQRAHGIDGALGAFHELFPAALF